MTTPLTSASTSSRRKQDKPQHLVNTESLTLTSDGPLICESADKPLPSASELLFISYLISRFIVGLYKNMSC